MSNNNIYSFFGDIVCINLKHRADRKEHSQQIFRELNISPHYYTAIKHSNGGMYGCFESHIDVVKYAYKKGFDNILVFEDDLTLTDSYNIDAIQNAIDFMKNNNTWDIFYLGYLGFNYNYNKPFLNAKNVTDNIVKYNPFATHALCYSRRAIQQIMDTYKDYIGKIHYDIYLSQHAGLNNYCYIPMLFDQKMCFSSDIEPRNFQEKLLRKSQCFADKHKLLYRFSFLKYFLEIHKYIIITVLIIIIMLLLLV
jgi:GR25 family glycosyltransferase involved in LPS biosynthesis